MHTLGANSSSCLWLSPAYFSAGLSRCVLGLCRRLSLHCLCDSSPSSWEGASSHLKAKAGAHSASPVAQVGDYAALKAQARHEFTWTVWSAYAQCSWHSQQHRPGLHDVLGGSLSSRSPQAASPVALERWGQCGLRAQLWDQVPGSVHSHLLTLLHLPSPQGNGVHRMMGGSRQVAGHCRPLPNT